VNTRSRLEGSPRSLRRGQWVPSVAVVVLLAGGLLLTTAPAHRPGGTLTHEEEHQTATLDTIRLRHLMCRVVDSLASADRGDTTRGKWLTDCERRIPPAEVLGGESRRLLDIHWSIAEYHDEQRLRDGPAPPSPVDSTMFGPVVFFYAMPHIETFRSLNQINAQWPQTMPGGPRGTLVGIIVVVQDTTATPLPESYRRLHLVKGVNCLWLAHDPARPARSGWVGYVGAANHANKCDRDSTRARELDVLRSTPSNNIHDYPPVVRFSEGTYLDTLPPQGPNPSAPSRVLPLGKLRTRLVVQPLLGVKCLAGLCEVGPKGFMPPDTFPRVALARMGGAARATMTKGWYDDQWLAFDSGGRLVPRVRAVVAPVPALDTVSTATFRSWYKVANIYLASAPPVGSKYEKWGLRAGDNQLQIRTTGPAWEARLLAAGDTAKVWTLARTPHHDEAVPGTARFRWQEYDDGIWIPCDQACCQAHGPLQ